MNAARPGFSVTGPVSSRPSAETDDRKPNRVTLTPTENGIQALVVEVMSVRRFDDEHIRGRGGWLPGGLFRPPRFDLGLDDA
jgi:hypothetical protein